MWSSDNLKPRLQDRLVTEQQRGNKLQAELTEATKKNQTAAADGASQLAAAQQALASLEEDANQRVEQADAAIAELEGQLEEATNQLQDAQDATKVFLPAHTCKYMDSHKLPLWSSVC